MKPHLPSQPGKSYIETYLDQLPMNEWIEIQTLPNSIGLGGIAEMTAAQTMEDKKIILGKLCCTFMIVSKLAGRERQKIYPFKMIG